MTHTTLSPRLARIGLLSACLLLAAPVASAAELPSASPETVEQALNSGRPTILDLGARACIPCKRMAPILAGLAETYRERAQVLFIDLHEDEAGAQDLAHPDVSDPDLLRCPGPRSQAPYRLHGRSGAWSPS
ncbi:MAG: thioredoxin family protein [Chromatiales bacterium]|nr:thioredoxin family protein [Chromatiales bacterium]